MICLPGRELCESRRDFLFAFFRKGRFDVREVENVRFREGRGLHRGASELAALGARGGGKRALAVARASVYE